MGFTLSKLSDSVNNHPKRNMTHHRRFMNSIAMNTPEIIQLPTNDMDFVSSVLFSESYLFSFGNAPSIHCHQTFSYLCCNHNPKVNKNHLMPLRLL